jgi:hypothetical protein
VEICMPYVNGIMRPVKTIAGTGEGEDKRER